MEQAASRLESVISRVLQQVPAAESVLLAWPVACGSAVAERTQAVAFSDGILQVEVSDAGWRRELSALAPRYLAAVNRYARAKVERIEFVVKG